MAIILEAVAANGTVQHVPLGDTTTTIAAQPGLRYRLFNDAGGRVSPAALVRRVDGDLLVEGLPESKVLALEGFFTRCTPQNACSLSMDNIGGTAEEIVTPATVPVAALPEGGFLMYASGMTASSAAAPRESEFSFKPVLGVLGGLAIAGGAGGGGGGGSRGGGVAAPTAPVLTNGAYVNDPEPVFTGTALAGTEITMTLDVGNDGVGPEFTYRTTAAADGRWTIDTGSLAPITGTLPPIAEGQPIGYRIQASNSAGVGSPVTTGVVTLDTIPPAAAEITSALLTNSPTPVISGTGEPGSIVTVALDLEGDGVIDATYTATVTPAGTWSVDLAGPPTTGRLPGDRLGDVSTTNLVVTASDLAGNSAPPVSGQLHVDTRIPEAPTIDPVSGDRAISAAEAGSPVTITGTLPDGQQDRPVTVTWGGTTLTATVSGLAWSVTFSAAQIPADGTETVIASYTNIVGTTSVEGRQDVLIDRVPPAPPEITDNAGGVATGPVTFTFTFAEPVNGFTAADVAVSGGSKGAFTGVDGGTVYTLVVTPTAGIDNGTISVAVPAGGFTDIAGNASVAAAPAHTQPFDTLAPTITISDNASGTASGPVTFTFTFSEPVSGFTAEDITVTNGTKGAFTPVSSSVYTLVVTPATEVASGSMIVSVPAGAATDQAGNQSVAQSTTQPIDTVSPTLSIDDNVDGATANGPVTFTFTFSEPVTGFGIGDIVVAGGSPGTLTGSGSSYSLIVTPPADDTGTVSVSVAGGAGAGIVDAAGNLFTGPASASQAFDTNVPPALEITDDEPGGTATGPVTFTFTFSEPVTGFVADDITVTGGSKGALTGSGAIYQMLVTPIPDTAGTITVNVPAGTVTDLAGNASVASASTSQGYDVRVPPTLEITDNFPGATTNSPVTFTFTFSEAVTGFVAGEVTVTGGTPDAFTQVSSSVYTLVVTPTPGVNNGTIEVSVPTGAASDAAGNPSVGPVSAAPQGYDTLAPTTTIAQIIDDALFEEVVIPPGGDTADATPTLVLNFSELFSGGSLTVLLDGVAIAGAVTQVDGDTVRFTGSAPLTDNGTYTYTARMTDAAGNAGALSDSYSIVFQQPVPPG